MQVTLTRRNVYKNGGASYSRPGVRASIYCGPKMFIGPAPEALILDAVNLAEPVDDGAAKAAKAEAAAQKKAAREEARRVKAEQRAQAKADRAAAKAAAAGATA